MKRTLKLHIITFCSDNNFKMIQTQQQILNPNYATKIINKKLKSRHKVTQAKDQRVRNRERGVKDKTCFLVIFPIASLSLLLLYL